MHIAAILRKTWLPGAGLLSILLLAPPDAGAGTVTTLADPAGDTFALTTLYPHPDPGRTVTVSGASVTTTVPAWLLGDPGSLTWFLGTYSFDGTEETQHDRVPDEGAQVWTAPSTSAAEDPVDAELDPTLDLRRGSLSPAGPDALAFGWELAGSVATGARFGYSSFNLDDGSRWVGIGSSADGAWYSYLQAGSVPFPWAAPPYADITAAEVSEGEGGRLELAMTLTGAIPASFGAEETAPIMAWYFDADGDPSTGAFAGMDLNAQVRYNRVTGALEAALRAWTGRRFEDLPGGVEAFTVNGDRVTLATRAGSLGLSRSFRWYAAVHVDVGPPDDVYQNRVDATDITAMALSEDPGTEPGLAAAGAWVFPLSFPVADPRFAAALEDLLINSGARPVVQEALGCEHVACSVGDAAATISAALATGPQEVLRVAPLIERLAAGYPAFAALLSTGNNRWTGLAVLDFLGAGPQEPDLWTTGLTLCVQDTGSPACEGARTLLTAAELRALDPQKSYVIVPRSAWSLPAETCVACGDASVTLRVSTLGSPPLTATASVILYDNEEASLQTLEAGSPRVVEPDAQAQARLLTAYLEFPAEETADRERAAAATACTVDVILREANGDITSRTTVPARGLQSIDLGVRPPEDWKLVLVSTCAARIYVSLEDRSYRGIRACVPGEGHLCLGEDGRFRVEVSWRDPRGNAGTGHALPRTAETGGFWFFSAENVELLVKVLDGAALNRSFWVFYAGLSDVEYEIRVTDTRTGAVRTYVNPAGLLASAGHTSAFTSDTAAAAGRRTRPPALPAPLPPAAAAGTCAPSSTRLCLGASRFAVEVAWRDFAGQTGAGQALEWTAETGLFWFFAPDNLELAVKILDGTGLNGHHWLFSGALSNVAYTVTVTDTVTGAVRRYENPAGRFASFVDTGAF